MKITDHSGSISITAFGKFTDMIDEVYEDGKEDQFIRGNGENDKTDSISSNAFKIVLTPI